MTIMQGKEGCKICGTKKAFLMYDGFRDGGWICIKCAVPNANPNTAEKFDAIAKDAEAEEKEGVVRV